MTYYKYMLMFQIDVGSGYFAINVILLLESSLLLFIEFSNCHCMFGDPTWLPRQFHVASL